ncbi:hypothetical protein GCM10029963_05870 [Micromonospora andamanensis]
MGFEGCGLVRVLGRVRASGHQTSAAGALVRVLWRGSAALIVLTGVIACSSPPRTAEPSGSSVSQSGAPVPPHRSPPTTSHSVASFNKVLHDELIGMFERDQAALKDSRRPTPPSSAPPG